MGYSPRGRKESDTTERLRLTSHLFFKLKKNKFLFSFSLPLMFTPLEVILRIHAVCNLPVRIHVLCA